MVRNLSINSAKTFDESSGEDSSSCSEDSDHDDHDNEGKNSHYRKKRTGSPNAYELQSHYKDLEENKVQKRKQATLYKLNNTWDISHAKEEVIEIIERYKGKDNTEEDIVISDTTAIYIRKSSQVKNEETRMDYLVQAIQALPLDAIKRGENSGNWYF
ncbi:5729_t:CDS:2 [Dentiscutata erythropus]|uniref:5729_t:CDS:1 n=1 Tax=Dentiscutata erythropus TaxID=1348616 RepID=A0A9N9ESQ0_9GLOM|nr:5729_t:CDS:2 [Dentiscutata erythropus]